MNFIRKTSVFLIGSLLPMFLLTFGSLFGLFQVLGSSSSVKQTLDQSGVYDNAVASIIKENATKSGAATQEASDTSAVIQKAVADSVSAGYVKEQAGGVLDGLYAWLNGTTSDLNFSVDLAPVKTSLIDNLTKQAAVRVQSLPTCEPAAQIAPDADAFSLTCLPAGVPSDQIVTQTQAQILKSDLFKNSTVTPQTLDSSGQPLAAKLKSFKQGYQTAKQTMYATGVASVLAIVAIILLSRPRQAGVKRAAYALITTGSLGIITALVGKAALQPIIQGLVEKSGSAEGTKITAAVQALVGNICNWWLGLGIISVLVAIAMLVSVKIWNSKHHVPKDDDSEHKKLDSTDTSNNTTIPNLT